MEHKRRNQIEDALKASGAPAEALRILAGRFFSLNNLRKEIPNFEIKNKLNYFVFLF